MKTTDTKVIVIYGGRSTEHEISCKSAAFVLRNIDRKKYEVAAIAIDKKGRWLPQNVDGLLDNLTGPVPILDGEGRTPLESLPLEPTPTDVVSRAIVNRSAAGYDVKNIVIFPVLHGTYGEDGSIQGFFNLGDLAFVGSGTLGSAIGMDKCIAKKLVSAEGIPVVPWVETRKQFYLLDPEAFLNKAETTLGYPIFVKPASLGSSVGINKVRNRAELRQACEEALSMDEKILLEKALDVREIECAVLGDYDPIVSEPGEVVTHGVSFYSYEAKYLSKTQATSEIPADLAPKQRAEARELSKRIFQCLECYGLARVDLFLDKNTGKFLFNEVNTLPGMTEVSQYPLLWENSGIKPSELIDRLINLALKRKRETDQLIRSR
jgi:D-alanine-D-alanine ligase